jgi:hypothetical protein
VSSPMDADYEYRKEFAAFQSPAPDGDHNYQTFCGT